MNDPRQGDTTARDGGDTSGGADLIVMPGCDMAERHFVGALLHLQPATIKTAAEIVFPEWLSDPQLAGVYAAIIDNAGKGVSEPAAVVPTMLRLGLPAQKHAVATALVIDLMTGCPMPRNWRLYAVLVATARIRNRLLTAGHVLVERAHRDPLDRLQNVLEEARLDVEATTAHVLQLLAGGEAA